MNSRRHNLLASVALSLCFSAIVGQTSTFASETATDTAHNGGAVVITAIANSGKGQHDGATIGDGMVLAEASTGENKSTEADSKPADAEQPSVENKSTKVESKPAVETKTSAAESGSTMPLPRGPNGELPAVLDPNKYSGQVKAGYAACKEVPEICDRLFCYCGCDLTDCHGSLLDCFTNDHGEDCHICQEEAIIALKLHKKGKTLSDIQKEVDKKFEKEYPFEVESAALQKYKANRLWDMGRKKPSSSKLGTIQPGSASTDPSKAADPTGQPDRKSQPKRKLKPDGSCCAGKD
jgi:hypothetical protein